MADQDSVTALVASIVRVLRTVHFDDERGVATAEVRDERTDRPLAEERVTTETAITELTPETPVGFGHAAAERPGRGDRR